MKQWNTDTGYFKKWHHKNKKKRNKAVAEYREEHKLKVRAQYRKYSKTPLGRFTKLKSGAKQRGLKFDLTIDQYKNLIDNNCIYCIGPLPKSGAGLDRIDNNKGYTIDNVVPCCRNCNVLRSNLLTKEEMHRVISLLHEMRGNIIWAEAK
jgi:hypothetical protein